MVDDKHKVLNEVREQIDRELSKNARRARKQKALKRKNTNRKRG